MFQRVVVRHFNKNLNAILHLFICGSLLRRFLITVDPNFFGAVCSLLVSIGYSKLPDGAALIGISRCSDTIVWFIFLVYYA